MQGPVSSGQVTCYVMSKCVVAGLAGPGRHDSPDNMADPLWFISQQGRAEQQSFSVLHYNQAYFFLNLTFLQEWGERKMEVQVIKCCERKGLQKIESNFYVAQTIKYGFSLNCMFDHITDFQCLSGYISFKNEWYE